MIAGNPFLNAPVAAGIDRKSEEGARRDAIRYNCLDGTAEEYAFPARNCERGLRAQVFFPRWVSKRLLSIPVIFAN